MCIYMYMLRLSAIIFSSVSDELLHEYNVLNKACPHKTVTFAINDGNNDNNILYYQYLLLISIYICKDCENLNF